MCTGIRFTDAQGNLYFGRNLDWTEPFGQDVFVAQRGFAHPSFMGGALTAKYASIGVAVAPDDCPLYFDAMNEEGLGVAGLNFPGYAAYAPAPIEGKANVPAYAFPLYIASQFKTVDEAEAALPGVAIVAKPFNDRYGVSLLHWLIGDAQRSIVVEYQEDGMHVYRDDLDVLTNQPAFPYHHENVRSYLACTPEYPSSVTWAADELAPYGSGAGMRGIPGDYYSPSRFVRAAYLNAHYPAQTGEADNVTRLFKTLGGVSMIKGAAEVADGSPEYTVYSGGYSAATKTYYYSTYDDPALQAFSLEKSGVEGGRVLKAARA